jgi:hypothetical protein
MLEMSGSLKQSWSFAGNPVALVAGPYLIGPESSAARS